MKLKNTFSYLSLLLITVIFLSACTKKETSGTGGNARMQVFLTDDPANYQSVFIDVQDIKINYSTNPDNGWVSLNNVNRGSYDILRLVNDRDTILADADLKAGTVEQIRLILGPNNYVVVNGVRHDLTTPSAEQSGLKLNIHQDINEGVLYKLLLDFDAARSIHRTGNGKYMLKPVIRTSFQVIGGSIKGYVLPNTIQTSVFAIQGTDTVAGTFTLNGGYMIKGLNAGTYNLSFVPSDTPTHKVQIKPGIIVNTNRVTTVDTVRLN
jgi:hypothetical protein